VAATLSPTEVVEREQRFALPVAVATFLAFAMFAVSIAVLTSKFGTTGNAEHLRDIDKDSGSYVLLNVLQAAADLLLLVPILYLFTAAGARSDRMRHQFVGLVIAGPIFLAAATAISTVSVHDAASAFVAKGVLGTGDHANKVADDTIRNQSLHDLAGGLGIGGALGVAFAVSYSSLYAMRTGLLTRFVGSAGVAMGPASVIPQFFPIFLVWLLYLGLVFAGWVRHGRPPAWKAGEAIPWPTPGERMAEQMKGEDGEEPEGEPAAESGEDEGPDLDAPEEESAFHRPRKRKRRSGT
jgi:hypothetical protein